MPTKTKKHQRNSPRSPRRSLDDQLDMSSIFWQEPLPEFQGLTCAQQEFFNETLDWVAHNPLRD